MGEKYFQIKWKDNKVDYLKGTSISDAFRKAGYGGSAINAIDTWTETPILPVNHKEIVILNSDGKGEVTFYPHEHGLLVDAIREEILKRSPDYDGDMIKVNICGREYEYIIIMNPFQVICKAHKPLVH